MGCPLICTAGGRGIAGAERRGESRIHGCPAGSFGACLQLLLYVVERSVWPRWSRQAICSWNFRLSRASEGSLKWCLSRTGVRVWVILYDWRCKWDGQKSQHVSAPSPKLFVTSLLDLLLLEQVYLHEHPSVKLIEFMEPTVSSHPRRQCLQMKNTWQDFHTWINGHTCAACHWAQHWESLEYVLLTSR